MMKSQRMIVGWIAVATLCLASACAPDAHAVEAPPSSLPLPTLTPTLSQVQQEIWGLWRRGGHSKTVENLRCETCHQVNANGEAVSEIVWRNPDTGSYEAVSNSIELCGECHREVLEIRHTSLDPHATFQCTVCHEPHRVNARCTSSGCHPSVAADLEIINNLAIEPGHETTEPHHCGGNSCHAVATQVAQSGNLLHIGVQHAYLTCAACHDAAGMEIGPVPNSSQWNTWLPAAGSVEKRPFFSHSIQRQVDCERCHFEGNLWELPYPVTNIKSVIAK